MFKNKLLLVLGILCVSFSLYSQDLSAIKNIDVASLSDEQIATYWEAIKEKGYTLSQLDQIAKVQGIPASKVAEFKARVNNLQATKATEAKIINDQVAVNLKEEPFGINDEQIVKKDSTTSELFGYDFFNNSKISFTPNLNVAVPDSYQLGPGDELTIDLWGASEITYQVTVTKQGQIKIPGIGFIYVNGLSLNSARPRITANLKKKHSGIGAANSSYAKIYTNITVSKIRTVQVSIIGEIKTPGTYAINSLASMLNAIYAAGGPTKMGSFRKIELVRNNKTIGNLDVYDYLLQGKTNAKLKLQDQDVLLVKPYQNLITVKGAVKRPGIYELNPEETLQDLINYFGGFTPKSYTNLFVLERLIDGKEKAVKEVTLAEAANFKMQAGDKLLVQESLDIFKNKVTVNGEVFRPGNFELTPQMTLKEVIDKADGVTKDAFLQRGLLVRTYDNFTKENIAFSIPEVMNGTTTIALQKDDEILIFNKKELKEARSISVSGAVNKPTSIDFIDKLQIEDVIALAGGLKEGADAKNIYVSRRLNDGSYKTLSKVFTLSSSKNLAINDGEPFYLEPFDEVVVRYAKGYTTQQSVSIAGEVGFPGAYVLQTKDDRISDLIQQAGGLTEFAYPIGATLKRKAGFLTKDLSAFQKLGEENDSLVSQSSEEYTVAIDLVKILQNPKSDIDILLRPGDRIVIPEVMQTVQIVGEVYVPSLVQFQAGKSLKYYISNSGGYTDDAKKRKIAVQYSNGEIQTVKNFLFFKSYPRIKPGTKILVPKKPERKKMSTQEIIGITTGLATLGLLIQSLVN